MSKETYLRTILKKSHAFILLEVAAGIYCIWFLQETLDELANASGTEFEIPENFDEQVMVSTLIGVICSGLTSGLPARAK